MRIRPLTHLNTAAARTTAARARKWSPGPGGRLLAAGYLLALSVAAATTGVTTTEVAARRGATEVGDGRRLVGGRRELSDFRRHDHRRGVGWGVDIGRWHDRQRCDLYGWG